MKDESKSYKAFIPEDIINRIFERHASKLEPKMSKDQFAAASLEICQALYWRNYYEAFKRGCESISDEMHELKKSISDTYIEGYDDGYSTGYTEAYESAYDEGYNEGMKDAN